MKLLSKSMLINLSATFLFICFSVSILGSSVSAGSSISIGPAYFKGNDTYNIVVKENRGSKLKLYVNDKSPIKALVNKKGWATFSKVKLNGTGKISFTRQLERNGNAYEKPINYTRTFNATNNKVSFSSKPAPKPLCDGTNVKSNCMLDNVNYKTYIYHPAVPEKSHTEQVTTYQQKVTGSCTLCVDGTCSPTCATGRGACSHHGGVAQWNAPVTSNVPVTSTKTVVDAPARAEYYDKIAQ